MIRSHPSETTLLTYASGSLAPLHARVVAAHLAACSQCTDDIRMLEAVGGALLQGLPPTAMVSGALERAAARLDDAPPVAPVLPSVLTIEGIATGRWSWCGPGVHMMALAARDASDTRLDLIRVAPGTALLEHGHSDFETTMVLQGAFDDGIDHYHTGDFSEVEGGLDHRPRALAGENCICLIATSGRLRARGLLGRVMRPLLGM
jgi:putative transcriptional regulator